MKIFQLFLLFSVATVTDVHAQAKLFSHMPAQIQELSIDSIAYKKLTLPGSPDFLAVDKDEVWILNIDRVEKLVVKNKQPVLTVAVPGACGAMVIGFHSLWVASCSRQSIYRIDSDNGNILATIPCHIADHDGEIMLATGAGSLWVLSDSTGILTRISAATNRIHSTIKVLPNSYCAVYKYGAVWITNTNAHSVQRIDPVTNKVVATIPVGQTPRFIAAGENGIWTLNQGDGSVSRINPVSNKVVAVVPTGVPGSGGDIAAGAGRVWVRAKKPTLLQTINPSTNKVEKLYGPMAGSGAVRVTDHFVWVTAHDINTIWVLKR